MKMLDEEVVEILTGGGVCVMPTDTIYGIVASALDKKAVGRVYAISNRPLDNPCIVLIDSVERIKMFNGVLSLQQERLVEKYWPGAITFVFSCDNISFEYLHCGKKSLAFRVPDNEQLRKILEKTGPIIASSANRNGEKFSKNIQEAKKYFGDNVDLYVDGGECEGVASTLVSLTSDEPKVLRKGSVIFENL